MTEIKAAESRPAMVASAVPAGPVATVAKPSAQTSETSTGISATESAARVYPSEE